MLQWTLLTGGAQWTKAGGHSTLNDPQDRPAPRVGQLGTGGDGPGRMSGGMLDGG